MVRGKAEELGQVLSEYGSVVGSVLVQELVLYEFPGQELAVERRLAPLTFKKFKAEMAGGDYCF